MQIFYNPVDMQIMAVYTHDTDSDTWEQLGYEKISVAPGLMPTRDCRVMTITDGVLTAFEPSVNPIQPAVPQSELDRQAAKERGREKLRALGLTDEEISALRG